MSAIKYKRAVTGTRAGQLIGQTIPEPLWDRLTSAEIKLVIQLIEAAYLDGYEAAGGNTLDPVTHCERHRQHLCSVLGDGDGA